MIWIETTKTQTADGRQVELVMGIIWFGPSKRPPGCFEKVRWTDGSGQLHEKGSRYHGTSGDETGLVVFENSNTLLQTIPD